MNKSSPRVIIVSSSLGISLIMRISGILAIKSRDLIVIEIDDIEKDNSLVCVINKITLPDEAVQQLKDWNKNDFDPVYDELRPNGHHEGTAFYLKLQKYRRRRRT